MRTATGDLDDMKSRRSSEIFESLLHDRQRSYDQAKREGKKLIEAWKEQGVKYSVYYAFVTLRSFVTTANYRQKTKN